MALTLLLLPLLLAPCISRRPSDSSPPEGLAVPYTIGTGRSKWDSKDLSYKVTKYSIGLSRGAVDETTARAFKVWEDATCFNFTRQDVGNVDIEISFDGDYSFDGEVDALAHAFLPKDGGNIHVDDRVDWSVNSTQGTSLLMTLTHEIGHSLGLDHSEEKNAIMWHSYQGYDPNLSLHDDDIRGIQELYGDMTCKNSRKPSTPRPSLTTRSAKTSTLPCCETPKITPTLKTAPKSTTTRPSRTSTVPETSRGDNTALCNSDHIDTIVTMSSRTSYVFLGSSYWKLTERHGIHHPGYPRPIASDWAGLPNNLDAAFTWTNGKTYFFKGSEYWRFSDIGQMDPGFPKQLESGFPGIPPNVDAAFVWPSNDQLYVFKGSRYWKYPDIHHMHISNWDGIPDNLDAALQFSNGKSYFFKRSKYYLYNDTADSVSLGFPKETGLGWFDCSPSTIPLVRAEDLG